MKLNEIRVNNERANDFYKAIWEKNYFDVDVQLKKNGCEFRLINSNIGETVENIFAIDNKELFRLKLEQAISGSGKEDEKITNLRSSSLCSLLFFYNVTKKNPLILNLNGETCTFECSIFEFKNKVIRNPSNMDVVLFGYKNSDKKRKIICFLESKFGEYYFDVDTSLGIAYTYYEKYGELYNQRVLKALGYDSTFEAKIKNDSKVFEVTSSNTPSYIGGIKQMISHYIGVINFANGEYYKSNNSRLNMISEFLNNQNFEKVLLDKLKEDADIYLGEIVFDTGISKLEIRKGLSYIDDYKEKYKVLADILQKDNMKPKNVHIVKELFYYSNCTNWKHKIEDNILNYYFGNKLKTI